MRVLVTRPLEDAHETAEKLATLGHEAVIAPLLEIRFHDGPEVFLDGIQAILATSSNGVRALARRTAVRNVSLFAVGAQTAHIAHACGFQNVRDANGDGRALAAATITWASPRAGALLHAAGAGAPSHLAEDLAAHGFEVRAVTLYEAVTAGVFPSPAREALQAGTLDAVLHFSPRSARSFADCVAGASLGEACRSVISCCISSATAASLSRLAFREVRVASHPDQESVLALLR
jgi:uroporphyrinogen-III synthase